MKSNEDQIRLLLERLERISADSYWAHRASGARGSLLNLLEKIEVGAFVDGQDFAMVTSYCYEILTRAAQEMGKAAS